MLTKRGTTTWYDFNATTPTAFNAVDDILSSATVEPVGSLTFTYTRTFGYDPNGTRQLTSSLKSAPGGSGADATYSWVYDVFGNRSTESPFIQGGSCGQQTTWVASYNADNQLTQQVTSGCNWKKLFWNDATGNRLAQTDTLSGSYIGPATIMSYTAKGELIFSMTPTVKAGDYNYNWHWYGPGRQRVISVKRTGTQYVPSQPPSPGSGVWNYYLYDGPDVALVLKGGSGSWWVEQRYMMGGVDAPLADRFSVVAGSAQNLALVSDRQGTTLMALKNDWTPETAALYYRRNVYGHLEEGNSSGSTINTQTAYTGASTPNQGGGFVYLRNRWYDPQTGRFLTQDPIGLASSVNLYAYAANNPIRFTDPFGLQADTSKKEAQGCPKVGPPPPECQALEEVTLDKKITGIGLAVTGLWGLGRALLGRFLSRATVAAGTGAAAKTLIPEGELLLVAVKDGKVVVQTADVAMSHAGLAQRAFGTATLPEGAWIGTVGKLGGQITVLNSKTFFGNQAAAPGMVQDLITSLFR